jgi:hypothetical protein
MVSAEPKGEAGNRLFHKCYGSPLALPVTALRRIDNVEWTGVRLQTTLITHEVNV